MKIIKTYNWNRRDFVYDAQCEHCKNIDKNSSGYDDSYYYNEVIPNQKCSKCGESTNSKQSEEVVLINTPRYDSNLVM